MRETVWECWEDPSISILSALIFQEKNDVEEVLTIRMDTACSEMIC
jgi:hypothetical protein